MTVQFLSGPKTYLRPIEISDAERYQRWLNDPEVRRYLLAYLPFNLPKETKFIENLYQNDTDITLAVVLKDGDLHIGGAGLHRVNHRHRHAEFGILIGEKSEWGKGYGTEAAALIIEYGFNSLNLNRVYLRVLDHNERGIRSYEKLGFRREGVLRQDHFLDGAYRDTFLMGVLRAEWTFSGGA